VHLVGFIIRNLSRCTVTWTSKRSEGYCYLFGLIFGATASSGRGPPHSRVL